MIENIPSKEERTAQLIKAIDILKEELLTENNKDYEKLKEQSKKDSTKLKQIAGILKRQLRATGMIHKINDVLNKD